MYAFVIFNYILNMTKKEYPEEHLIKYFDDLGRIVQIDFLQSGNSCYITYVNDTNQKSTVTWNNGFTYVHNNDGSVTELRN